MTRKDFAKCLAIALKELSECRFWLRLVGKREWIAPGRLDPLLAETKELRKILGSMVVRTQAAPPTRKPPR